MYARVAVPVGVRSEFTYGAISEMVDIIRPGSMVVVEFGKKISCGIVVSRNRRSDRKEIKPIIAAVGGGPLFDDSLLD